MRLGRGESVNYIVSSFGVFFFFFSVWIFCLFHFFFLSYTFVGEIPWHF